MKIYRDVFGDEPPAGGWALAYYETEAATPGGWEHATAGLQDLSKKYPDDQDYRLALGRLYTYRPQTRERGIQLLESIPATSAQAAKAREAWRQALVWQGAHPASAASYRSFLARYPDPELQKMLSEMKAPAPAEPAMSKSEILARARGKTPAIRPSTAIVWRKRRIILRQPSKRRRKVQARCPVLDSSA